MSSSIADRAAESASSAASRLRTNTAAVRLSFTWFGTRKTLTPEQRSLAAESFGAEGAFLSAGKKIVDTKHPAFRAVTAVRGRLVALWKAMTLPYVEGGVRLLRQDRIADFDAQMTSLREELQEAVAHLDEEFSEIQRSAARRLGSLYDPNDYPQTLRQWFKVEWDYPNVQPPEYLQRLNPRVYEEECRRVASRFEEAVQLAEQAFSEEFAKLVSHLTERLNGENGEQRVFRDTTITNLTEFFARFRDLNVRSNPELDSLVERAQQIVRGVSPQDLRDVASVRRQIATELAGVQSVLDGLLVDRPRRRLIRNSNGSQHSETEA